MDVTEQIESDLDMIAELSPAGFAIAFHIRFATPAFLFQTYSKDWLDIYSSAGLVMHDPIVKFGFTSTGTVRWSDLADQDPAGVLEQGAAHGMVYGIAIAIDSGGSRSVAGHARGDREYTDEEIAQLESLVSQLHRITMEDGSLSAEAHDKLKRLSVALTHPDRDSS